MKWLPHALTAAAVSLTLGACGGKTDTSDILIDSGTTNTGTTATLPTGPASGSVTRADGCQIAVNASSCAALLSFTTANAKSPTLKVGVPLVSASHAVANFAVTIGHGTFAVVLADGSTVLDATASVSGACVPNATWDGNACKANG